MDVIILLGAYALASLVVASAAYLVDQRIQSFALYFLLWPFVVAILGFLFVWSVVVTLGNRKA